MAPSGKDVTVHPLYEKKTGSWQYIVADPSTSRAVIIDPVLDYDAATCSISTQSADALLQIIQENNYQVNMILETHAHADHMTAASYLHSKLDPKPLLGIGKRIRDVQEFFRERYRIPKEDCTGAFDKLFEDDEAFSIGGLSARAIYLPGHTPDHMGYMVEDNVFVGDSIFHPDLGSARADFPGGSAKTLFASGRKLLSLPEHTKVWIGHDYPPQGREAPVPSTDVASHRRENKHLKDAVEEREFVEMRQERDKTLAEPKLLHQAMQMNLRGGKLPGMEGSGLRMLYSPLKLNGVVW